MSMVDGGCNWAYRTFATTPWQTCKKQRWMEEDDVQGHQEVTHDLMEHDDDDIYKQT